MKTQLIKMPEQSIIVSDEWIGEGDQCYVIKSHKDLVKGDIFQFNGSYAVNNDCIKKIIAGLSNLPIIDYNGLEEKYGLINIDFLVGEATKKQMIRLLGNESKEDVLDDIQKRQYYFRKGFKTAQSLKQFNLDDIKKAVKTGIVIAKHFQDQKAIDIEIDKYLDFKSKPIIFDIEIEVESNFIIKDNPDYFNYDNGEKLNPNIGKPKITNNSIKIIK